MLQFLQSLPSPIAQGILWGIMAIGVYITYRVLDIADLTVDGTLGLGGAVLVVLTTSGVNIWLSLCIAFLAGCLAGLVTGILHTKFGIPAILSGILTQLALYSITLRVMSDRANTPISRRNYNLIVSSFETSLPKTILVGVIFVAVIIAVLYWFFGTELGRGVRATGCNAAMAKANGINIDTQKIIGLVLSNGLVALSGGLLAQFSGNADVNMGKGAIVIGLAAVIIGEVVFGKIFKNFALRLVAVVLGAIIYYIVIAAALKFGRSIGLTTNDMKLVTAVVVAVFLAVPYWKKKYDTKNINKSKGGKENA